MVVYPLDRTEPFGRDLAWLPSHLRALRSGTVVALWTSTTLAAIATAVLSGGAFAHLALLLGAGGFYAGDRLSRAIVRAQVRRLARGRVDLANLHREADGELVHVRGKVSAQATLPGFLHGTPSVYRRMSFVFFGTRLVHHAAVDFDLVDESGELVTVQVAGARLLAPEVEHADYPATRFSEQPLPPTLERLFAGRRESLRGAISAGELLLRHGDDVEIVGYKTRTVDPRVAMRLARDTPMRATLRAGRELPLLITPTARRSTSER